MGSEISVYDFGGGNVGIGTTDVNATFSVVKSVDNGGGMARFVNSRTVDDAGPTTISSRVGTAVSGTAAMFIEFRGGATSDFTGTQVGKIRLNNSAVAYDTTSDQRLKENVQDTLLGLDVLNQIQVRDFNFIADPQKVRKQGFVAQELHPI